MRPAKRFIGKVAIITGASVGIGAEIAFQFAQEGANLTLNGRNEADLNTVAKQCQSYGAKTYVLVGDISKEEVMEKLINDTVNTFGKLDILVNNAAVLKNTGCHIHPPSVSMDNYDEIMRVNLRACYYLTSLSIPHLKKTKGNIINISSIAGHTPLSGLDVYCMTKAAMDMMTKSAAVELARFGIRVNSINPGLIKTEITRAADFGSHSKNDEYINNFIKMHAMERLGRVEEVANAVSFLASDEATFMTGSFIFVDGGYMWNRPTLRTYSD